VAIGAILARAEGRRKVIKELTDADHAVVAIRAKRGGNNVTRPVAKDAGSEGTRCMTNTAILDGRQVSNYWLTDRRNAMTKIACVSNNGRQAMIDEGVGKIPGIVTTSTILGRCLMNPTERHRHRGCVNCSRGIVA
jgi:hypothetical protein